MDGLEIRDKWAREALDRDGFIVLPQGARAELESMLTLYREFCDEVGDCAMLRQAHYNTIHDFNAEVRERVHRRVVACLRERLEDHFSNHEIVVALLYVKTGVESSGTTGNLPLHFDPTLLRDENTAQHIKLWIPLVDVDENSGALWVIPRTHRLIAPVHDFSIPSPLPMDGMSMLDVSRCVNMQAGDILIFDNRLAHFSLNNSGDTERPALALSVITKDAECLEFFGGNETGEIEVFRRPRNHYNSIEFSTFPGPPARDLRLGVLAWRPSQLNLDDLKEKLRDANFSSDYTFSIVENACGPNR